MVHGRVAVRFLLLCGLLALVAGCGAAATPPAPGRIAPSFVLARLPDTSQTVSLSDLLRKGEPVILNAWASWCQPCAKETPELVQAAKRYQGRIEFVGINMTEDDKLADARRFAARYKIPYLLLADLHGEFSKAYHIEGYPTTVLIDPEGRIQRMQTGQLRPSNLQHLIRMALRDQADNSSAT
ncbi:TlpA family protein disulfide reductase [Alicyclobacillus shizuokensis]|uniref:TlpA family protein disulfide reductase n=1 Tax=Alicyclobacillus shizuokensis TaxID=392014 RepID=UPI00082EDF3F|nr:TlpA disulfide reductase family protein [Alicyclobacillus shizuokensis]MCL6626858.1 TlpA family protein disulfide reductase [Alicyclobacillus shizuokensis]